MWFVGVEVEQETSAPPPKKSPGSAPELIFGKDFNYFFVNGKQPPLQKKTFLWVFNEMVEHFTKRAGERGR